MEYESSLPATSPKYEQIDAEYGIDYLTELGYIFRPSGNRSGP
jgi:hypothetical protein